MKYVKPLKLYQESFLNVFMLNKNPIPGFLALDVCEGYVSLAMTDRSGYYARAESIPSLSRRNSIDNIAYMLKAEISDNNLGGIVVGCSCVENKDKSDPGQAKILIDHLRKTGNFDGLKYTYWDRKLTSKDKEIMEISFVKRSYFPDIPEKEIERRMQKMREGYIPKIRATLLLQGFMDYGDMCVGKVYG